MGLLDKTNPRATRASVIRWACFGAIVAPLLVLINIWAKIPVGYWWINLLLALILGSALGALMEWQVDDGPDEDELAGYN